MQDDTVDPNNLCGFLYTDGDGTFSFKAIKPTPYKVILYNKYHIYQRTTKVPEDGPGGALMAYTGRNPWRPAHIHFIIEASGYQKVYLKVC